MPDASTDMIAAGGASPTATPPQAADSDPSPYPFKGHPSGVMDFFARLGSIQSGMAMQQRQQQLHQREQSAEQLTGVLQSHPELSANPEFMKLYGKTTSPEVKQGMELWGHAESAKRKQAQVIMQGGGQPEAGASQAGADDLGALRKSEMARLQNAQRIFENLSRADPNDPHLPALKADIESHQKLMDQYFKEADYQQTQKRLDQAHEDNVGLREAGLAQSKALTEATQAQVKATADFNEQFKTSQQAIAKAKDDSDRQAKVDALGKNIDTERDKVLADFAKTPTPAVKARVDGYNASASMFYKRHANAGAPTLLKYSEEPGTMQGLTGGKLGSPNPKVEAVAPQYGTNKKTGQSGWLDADGNFYADSDEATAAK